ncbi:MAG: thiolase family protein [Thermincola sp.]|jgi:acetyl-CoA C-acetyltransferase|nr:thiolase family protein [Thermincola sp.]MDT3704980.1 thiolase family protein [Thermincola sp.]
MEKVYLLTGVRSPYGKFGGSLKDLRIEDLSARVLEGVVQKAGLSKDQIQEIFWGVGNTAESEDSVTPVVARQALLIAGFPPETRSLNIDRACCSATAAIQMAYRSIKAGEIDIAIAGGVETFSHTPFMLRNTRWAGKKMGDVNVEDPLFELGYSRFNPVAVDAGEVALEYGVSREEQDKWAYQSQQRYAEAKSKDVFSEEIIPIEISNGKEKLIFGEDEAPRPNTTLEKLAKLPTIYGSPTCTAGNAPGLNDGAAAVILISESKLKSLKLEPLAEIVNVVAAATEPRLIPVVPAVAVKEAIRKANINVRDLELIEINEAFAAMPLVSTKVLAEGDEQLLKDLREKTNVNGGAIAIGHPNASSGARILMTLAYELRRRKGTYGISAICGGLSQGDAVLIKR